MENAPLSDDLDTRSSLQSLSIRDEILKKREPGVQTILVILSAAGMAFDLDALQHQIHSAYPEAAIFFRSTSGKPLGSAATRKVVDLLIDLTGPGQRQGLFFARKLRRSAKLAVGRNAGLFRKRIYDRVYDEKALAKALPMDSFDRERIVQMEVMKLAGIPFVPAAQATPDQSKNIALELPPLVQN